MMKKYILGLLVFIVLWACSKEDWPDNTQPEVNFFAVPEGATGEEAELRRTFFDKNGVYLLFSDTLGIREVTAISGEKVQDYQVLDFMWTMSVSTAYWEDSLEFFTYENFSGKKTAAEFLEKEVLANLPELFYPYSVLMLDRMICHRNIYGMYYVPEDISIFSGMQATAFALGDVTGLSEEEKETLKNALMQEMVVHKISVIPDDEFSVFYGYSNDYYGISSWNVPNPVQSVGFLDTYQYSWTVEFNSKSIDKLAYVEEVYRLPETEFRETYADYPLVIEKMEEMVRILRKYGVKIYE